MIWLVCLLTWLDDAAAAAPWCGWHNRLNPAQGGKNEDDDGGVGCDDELKSAKCPNFQNVNAVFNDVRSVSNAVCPGAWVRVCALKRKCNAKYQVILRKQDGEKVSIQKHIEGKDTLLHIQPIKKTSRSFRQFCAHTSRRDWTIHSKIFDKWIQCPCTKNDRKMSNRNFLITNPESGTSL